MTRIAQIRLKNFKSFKNATIPLSNGFTTIAGSNGSGKSNILDAVLFGLGITSLKMIRASKLIDLINHDTKENYAQVELTLKDGAKEFQVNRTIDSQGKSVCRLNGKRCTLSEIENLLLEIGVKVDGHNIVVQGDITKIIEMNDVERREIIDEVAGLKEYDEKKAEALKELEKVNIRIKEARIVLTERQIYLQELEKEKIAALKNQELNKELRQCKATMYDLEIKKLREELDKKNSEEREIQKTINEISYERDNNSRKITELEKKFEDINETLIKSSEKTFEGIGKEIEEKKSNIRISEERIQSSQTIIIKNKNKIKEITEEKENSTENIQEKEKQVNFLKQEISLEENKLKELEKQKKAQDEVLKTRILKQNKIQEKIDELNNSFAILSEKAFEIKLEKQVLKEKENILQEKIKELKEKKETLTKNINEKQNVEQEIKNLTNLYKDIETELKEKTSKLHKTLQEIGLNESLLKELHEKMHKLKEVKAKCPLCEQELEEKLKQAIVDKKKLDLVVFDKTIKELKERKSALEGKIETLTQVKNKLTELNAKTSGLKELEKEKEQVEHELKKNNLINNENKLIQLNSKESELEKEMNKIKEEKNALQNQLKELELNENELQLNEKTELKRQAFYKKLNEINKLEIEINEAKKRIQNYSNEEIAKLEKEINELNQLISSEEKNSLKEKGFLKELEIQLKKITLENKELLDEKIEVNKQLFNSRKELEDKRKKIDELYKKINEIKINKSKNEVRVNDLEEEFKEFIQEELFSDKSLDELKKLIPKIENEIKSLGEINMKAIKGFTEFQEEVEEITRKAAKLEEERISVLELINKIEVKRTTVFMECFKEISSNFNKMYLNLSGAEGKISLSNSEKPLESGLVIEAKHSGDKLKNIDSMSGGEKSLTALAFLFAIQLYNPAPFYIFDEADAALDKPNSQKLASMIKEISQQSQFIAVTHNDAMVESSDQIIGVTLSAQNSSVIGLKIKEQLKASV